MARKAPATQEAIRKLEHAAEYLEKQRAEHPAGHNLVQRESSATASALEFLYQRLRDLREQHSSGPRLAMKSLWRTFLAGAQYLAGGSRKPGEVTRWLICPEWGMRASVTAIQAPNATDGLQVTDIVACSIFPRAAVSCNRKCLRQF